MKTLIFILIIASFIQSTVIPIDLVLIILICRSYIRADKANLFLAFGFGLFIAHLNLSMLGLHSLIYLVLVAVTESLSRSRLSGNSFLIVPLSLLLLIINQLVTSFFVHESTGFPFTIFAEAFLSLPVLYLVRFWEERFIIQKGIKLRL